MQLFFVDIIFLFIIIISTLSCFVRADALTDAIHLHGLASNTADTIFASLNGTAYLNTSDLVARVTTAIQGADSILMANVSSSGTTNMTFNDAYFNYADSLLYLADTVQRRGRLYHSEMNLPVYQALQKLSSAVSSYGYDLTSRDMLKRNSTIRTMTTGSAIARAQSAWANNQNYPGKRDT